MSFSNPSATESSRAPIPVESMRTLLVCRGPIAFETLEVYRRCQWQLPHVVVSSKEWIAEIQRAAPWIVGVPTTQVHYLAEYNDVEAVLRIAREHKIEAIYPGYGFLAENAAFAEQVEQAGMRFIGPTPEALRAVGDKDSAIALAKRLGIPTIPGDDALVAYAQTHPQAEVEAEAVRRTVEMAQRYPDYPIRFKHPAGGGGKGQRVLAPEDLQGVGAEAAILEALTKLWAEMGVSSAEADAQKGVLLELNIPRPLHWEVQLFGDGETVVHFAARDCSLQNQGYQKFIELALHPSAIEAEAAALDPEVDAVRVTSLKRRQATLERICADALRLGQAIQLRGAATVEFLIDEQGEPYFLEVNPRIQVEHAVTEGISRVHGAPISLVELQQRVAAGERLGFRQSDITWVGDTIEVRLNAWHEDLSPVLGGVVEDFAFEPPADVQTPVRIDASGLLQRRTPWIVPSYDANFALIVVSGKTRHDALDQLMTVLETALQVRGNDELRTNLQPMLGLLALMRALPPETAFRTDTSLLWMALVASVVMQKQAVMSLLPSFPRQVTPYDSGRFARLLRQVCDAGFENPSRLLTAYIKRLTQVHTRPLAPLEVMWMLADELKVVPRAEEVQQGIALRQAIDAVWAACEQSEAQLVAFSRIPVDQIAQHPEAELVLNRLMASEAQLTMSTATELLQTVIGWMQAPVPALQALAEAIERTELHTLLIPNDDLSLSRPDYLGDAGTVVTLNRLLSSALRPTMLREGELLSPMEATIFRQPEPGAPSFVDIGSEISVGQTLALLEAMKMFSELPSPVDGVVVDILVENGQGVKTGEPLFKIMTQDEGQESGEINLPQVTNQTLQNRFRLL